MSAYQRHPRVVAVALNASLRFALSVVALTRHIICGRATRAATKAAGDEAQADGHALARDLRKGEDGLDESLRDAFLGAGCRAGRWGRRLPGRGARLALDEPLEPSYVAAYRRIRAHTVLLLGALFLRLAAGASTLLPDHRNQRFLALLLALKLRQRAARYCQQNDASLPAPAALVFWQGRDARLGAARPTREARPRMALPRARQVVAKTAAAPRYYSRGCPVLSRRGAGVAMS